VKVAVIAAALAVVLLAGVLIGVQIRRA